MLLNVAIWAIVLLYTGCLGQNRCSYVKKATTTTFNMAKSNCERDGGALPMMKDSITHDAIVAFAKKEFDIYSLVELWMGAKNNNGQWEWIDGTPMPMWNSDDFQKWIEDPAQSAAAVAVMSTWEQSKYSKRWDNFDWYTKASNIKAAYICEFPGYQLCDDCRHGTCTTIGCQMNCKCDSGYSGYFCDQFAAVAAEITSVTPSRVVYQNNGQTKSVFCNATGNPAPAIAWYKDGKAVEQSEITSGVYQAIMPNYAELILINMKKSEAGSYICEATNIAGTVEKSAQVQLAAEITSVTPSIVVYQNDGQTKSIFCNATGNPAPGIAWYKDGKVVEQNEITSGVYQTRNPNYAELIPKNMKKSEAGSYICKTTNIAGTDDKTAQVQLAAEVSLYPDTATIDLQKTQHVRCTPMGFPTPTVIWYKDGKEVDKSRILVFPENYYLKYSTKSDTGVYTCKASNIVVGENDLKTDSKNVTIFYPLTLTNTNPATERVKYNTTWVRLSCTFEGYPEPQVDWQIRQGNRENFKPIPKAVGSIFSIKTISTYSFGTFVVKSGINISLARFLGPTETRCESKGNTGNFMFNKNTYLHADKHFYISAISEEENTEDAENICNQIGGTLATIPDKDTETFLNLKLRGSYVRLHIGARRDTEDGNRIWRWTNGSFLYNETKSGKWDFEGGKLVDGKYLNWKNSYPYAYKNENCLYFHNENELYSWKNYYCTTKRRFFCEIPAVGMPSSIKVTSEVCAPTIKVEWKPHPDSINITHRISLTVVNNATSTRKEKVEPKSADIQKKSFRKLLPSTRYIVKIKVCPDYCIDQPVEQHKITTGSGFPAEVENVRLSHQRESKACNISWSLDESGNQIVDKYEVTVFSTLVHTQTLANPVVNETHNTTSQSFKIQTQPNRNYTFQVTAFNCGGSGRYVKAHGECVSDPGAPTSVPKPLLSEDFGNENFVPITITLPDETNGPISCAFIIVDPVADQEGEISLQELREANEAAKIVNMEKRTRYIALALPRESFEEDTIKTKLGTGNVTRCNLMNAASKSKRSLRNDSEYEGQNHPLAVGKKYSFSVVTSTPTLTGPNLKTSSWNVFNIPSKKNQAWIAGLIVGLLLLICIIVVLIYLIKRRKKNKNPEETVAMSIVTSLSPQETESAYVNVIVREELSSKTVIRLEHLLEVYNSMLQNGAFGFESEFEELRKASLFPQFTSRAASDERVKKKNRYKNILPYDHSRVTLEGENNYINANFVDGPRQPKKFIATQGPLARTTRDFWMMILQNKCNVIVMLTNCFEKGKKKCEKYWPDFRASESFGDIEVTNIEEAQTGSYIKRTLTIKSANMEVQTTQQFQFVSWPDHNVPITTSGLLRFHRAVKRVHTAGGASSPVVVHCSAGAGRSGAFIAVDNLFEEIESRNKVDVFNCVLEMRKQRMDMIQNKDQYVLVHKLILEKCLFGNTELRSEDVRAKLDGFLRSPNNNSIRDEFDRLSKVGPMKAREYGSEFTSMNRSDEVLSYEHSRVVIGFQPEDENSPYINASNLETYDGCTPLIAAQGPMKGTIEYFWRAVYDNNVNTIVMLTNLYDGDREECTKYWPDSRKHKLILSGITLSLVEEDKTQDHVIKRVFNLTRQKSTKTILQLQYTDWKSNACPDDALTVIKLIGNLATNVASEGNARGLIHCSNGGGRTGAFCAILNLIEQFKCEDGVDVFRAAKDLRDCRLGMIQSLDQYVFCYRAVIDYVSSFGLYSNFQQ